MYVHILVLVFDSPGATTAVQRACYLSRMLGGRVTVLHCATAAEGDQVKRLKQLLAARANRPRQPPRWVTLPRTDRFLDRVVAEANNRRCDLIVCSADGWPPGITAHDVALTSGIPVNVMPLTDQRKDTAPASWRRTVRSSPRTP